jgi:hypothetical protein
MIDTSSTTTLGNAIGSGRSAYAVKDLRDRPTIVTCPKCGWQHSSSKGNHNCEESRKHG